jgi:hypothetical protein
MIKEEVNNNYVDNEEIAGFFLLLLELPDNHRLKLKKRSRPFLAQIGEYISRAAANHQAQERVTNG